MSEKLDLYERLKVRRTSLKGSITRKLRRLSDIFKHEFPDKAAFEQSDVSLQQTLSDFRATLKLMADLCFEMPKENYEQVKTDVDENEEMLEKLEIQAVD